MPDLPKVTISLEFDVNPAIPVDYDTYWRSFVAAPVGSLITAIDQNATTFTVSAMTKTVTTYTAPNTPPYGSTPTTTNTIVSIAPGVCLTLDQEPMTVVSLDGPDGNQNYQVTVVRGTSQTTSTNGTISYPLANPVPHNAGVAVNVLQYYSPWEQMKQRGLLPEIQAAVTSLGPNSAIYQSVALGQIQPNNISSAS